MSDPNQKPIGSLGRKTNLPSELDVKMQQEHVPNVIGNANQRQGWGHSGPVYTEKVTLKDLEPHASSKQELYDLLSHQAQLYLPPVKLASLSFLRDILAGRKAVFQNHELIPVKCPRYRELRVEAILAMVSKQPCFMKYLDNDIAPDRVSREYLFNVVNTVCPTFFAKVIPDAESKRVIPNKEDDLVVLDPKMLELIKSFKASRCGSKKGSLNLLKKGIKKRKRPEYEQKKYPFSMTIQEAMKVKVDKDVYARAATQQQMQRLKS